MPSGFLSEDVHDFPAAPGLAGEAVDDDPVAIREEPVEASVDAPAPPFCDLDARADDHQFPREHCAMVTDMTRVTRKVRRPCSR